MKNALLIVTHIFISLCAQAQDTICKRDGVLLIGIVKEIDVSTINYVKEDQLDGPLRKVEITQVAEIRYKNGTREIFNPASTPLPDAASHPTTWEPGTINTSDQTVVIYRRGPDIRVRPGQRFPKSAGGRNAGFIPYLDAVIGYGLIGKQSLTNGFSSFNSTKFGARSAGTIGIRFGSLIYFGNKERNKFGLNFNWISAHLFITDLNSADFVVAPLNWGLASSFKVGERASIDANITAGGMVISTLSGNEIGVRYGADVKFRYKGLGFGLDLSRSQALFSNLDEWANIVGISVGMRFK